jgi:hypothetical protein
MLQLKKMPLFSKLLKVELMDIVQLLDILLDKEMDLFLEDLLLKNLKLINGSHGPIQL